MERTFSYVFSGKYLRLPCSRKEGTRESRNRDQFFESGTRLFDYLHAKLESRPASPPSSFSPPPRRFVKFSLDRARTLQRAICQLYKYGTPIVGRGQFLKDNERFYQGSVFVLVGFPVITLGFTYFFFFCGCKVGVHYFTFRTNVSKILLLRTAMLRGI